MAGSPRSYRRKAGAGSKQRQQNRGSTLFAAARKTGTINIEEYIATFKANYRREFGWDKVKETVHTIEEPEPTWGECVVCFEEKPLLAATSQCTHKFCADCLERITISRAENGDFCYKTKAACPLCRQPFLSQKVCELFADNITLHQKLLEGAEVYEGDDISIYANNRMEVILCFFINSEDILQAVKDFNIGPGGSNLLAATVYLNLGYVFFLFPFGAEFEKAEEAFLAAISHEPRMAHAAQKGLRRARLRIEGHLPLPPISSLLSLLSLLSLPPMTFLVLLLVLCVAVAVCASGVADAAELRLRRFILHTAYSIHHTAWSAITFSIQHTAWR
jgi:hypothetical protein